jgi:TatD DNase family protein
MTLFDTHVHLNFAAYAGDLTAVLARAEEAGITRMLIPATDLTTSREAIALAQRYDGVYAAVGVHPNSTAAFVPDDIAAIRTLALSDRANIRAIGEIGLDYYWDDSPRSQQIPALEAQLALAAELELPVIIHNREASDDVIPILETWAQALPQALAGRAGVLHSFSAPRQTAERALEAGFYLGFTGPLTYKNSDSLRSIASIAPRDRVVVETDGPFLSPAPHRGKRNEPAYVRLVAERLAALWSLSLDETAHITTDNATRLFALS